MGTAVKPPRARMNLWRQILSGAAIRSQSCPATKGDLQHAINRIMSKLSELEGLLEKVGDQLDKAKTEIVAEIQSLKDALEDVTIPDGAQASLDRLSALAQALDDINPDVAPGTTPAPTP